MVSPPTYATARRFVLAAAAHSLILILAACDQPSWKITDGERPPKGTISMLTPDDHCGWESTTFLYIGIPFGSIKETGRNSHLYISDPENVFANEADHFLTTYDPDTTLPADAKYTGYIREGVEFWISDTEILSAVYMVDDEKIERWPKADPQLACD